MKYFRINNSPKIRLGSPFWGLILICLFLLLTRWLFSETFFLSSLYFIILYLVFAFSYSIFVLDGVKIKRKSRYQRRQVGDLYEESLMITNQNLLPVFWMQIKDRSDLGGNHANRVIGFLGGHQSRIIRMNSYLQKRGHIDLTPMEVCTSDPLGCFSATQTIETGGSLLISPYRVDLSNVRIIDRLSEEGHSIRPKLQHSDQMSGSVRTYTNGDPFNRIHWPTTARKGSLYTKMADETIQQMVWICLDCEKQVHNRRMVGADDERFDFLNSEKLLSRYALPPDSMEAAVSIACSLAVTWLKRGIAVGMAFNRHPYSEIQPGFGIKQQTELLNLLTFIQADSRISLPAMLQSISPRLKPSTICFLVSPNESSEMVGSIKTMIKKGVDTRLIHIKRESFGSGYDGNKLMRNWGSIPVLEFEYGDSLTTLLSVF